MSSGSRFRVALAALTVVIACMVGLNVHLHAARRAPSTAASTQEPAGVPASHDPQNTLRVCADPNNLPFSNRAEEGFENRLAELIAAELGRTVSYTWWPQRRGFIRNTLGAKRCDIVMGVPATLEMVQTTQPYYRSSYVFVTRAADELAVSSLDDPALKKLRIGLHAIGDDYSNVPPAQALAMRGIIDNVRGYSIYGDYSKPNPPRVLLDALTAGEIDIAIAWGPLAGYFARRESVPLEVTPIPDTKDRTLPTQFDISMGVRREDESLERELERIIATRSADIEALLTSYGVPLVGSEPLSVRRTDGGG